MGYFNNIEEKIQKIADNISLAFELDVTIIDGDLKRVAGTGDYKNNIGESVPDSSLFFQVIVTGEPSLNIKGLTSDKCLTCTRNDECKERSHMAYPIKLDGVTIGVVGFIAFTEKQNNTLVEQNDKCAKMIENLVEMIEGAVILKQTNSDMNINLVQVNHIINIITHGIIVINTPGYITNINDKAMDILGLNKKTEVIIGQKIEHYINNIDTIDTNMHEVVKTWVINGRSIKVKYKINDLYLNNNKISKIIVFGYITDIMNTRNTCEKDRVDFDSIISNSEKMNKVIEKAKIAARVEANIILTGESGTGKELFARAIHNNSMRKGEPFVAVNCASIPENLLEAEFFGYEKGAFTGANEKGRMGKFELANNGTLFLDEIGDLPIHLQPKLLRALQEKEIIRLGSNKPLNINVRIICATHKKLERLVSLGKFRHDFYYRLNVIPLSIPALRDRDDDVIICANYLLKKLCKSHNIEVKTLGEQVKKRFLTYIWTGNIRELENALEYAITFSITNEINLYDLPDYLVEENILNNIKIDDECIAETKYKEPKLANVTKEAEYKIIEEYINKYGKTINQKKEIADKLGISITTLNRRLKEISNKN